MITPGLHRTLPNADYHADPDYLSSSQLKALLPEHYKPFTGDGSALDVGTAFHTRALDTDEEIEVFDFPTWRSKAAEEARADARKRGVVPLLRSESEQVDAMVTALWSHDLAMRLLNQKGAEPELSAFATDDNGLRIKARFDLAAPVIVDLKSTSAMCSPHALTRAVIDYGYDLSARHYLDVAERVGMEPQGFALIFVGKTKPHHVTVVELHPEFLTRGARLIELAKARHLENATAYPGARDLVTLSMPPWAYVA